MMNAPLRIQVIGRLAHPTLWYPTTLLNDVFGRKRYAATLIFTSYASMHTVREACNDVAFEAWGKYGPSSYYHSPIRAGRPGIAAENDYFIRATSVTTPITRDITGMPERPDIFDAGQTVEMDILLCSYEGPPNRGIRAILHGIKLVGGFVRSIE